MAAIPPAPVTPAVLKGTAGIKGRIFTFKQLARKNAMPAEEIDEAATSFETIEDVDNAISFFTKENLDKVMPKPDDKKPAAKAPVMNAGTPPEKLQGSKSEDVPRFARFNTNAIENYERMNLAVIDQKFGAGAPLLRFNPKTQQYEVL